MPRRSDPGVTELAEYPVRHTHLTVCDTIAQWGLRLVLLLFVATSAVPISKSQPSPLLTGSEHAVTQLVHDVWRIEDGLPQNSVRAIVQTGDGYLWLGTEEGLARYNGISFKVFDKRNVDAFRVNQSVRALMEDSRGSLWIGTMGGGVVRYASGEFTQVDPESGLTGKVIGAFAEGTAGEVYVGTADQGLFVWRDGTFSSIKLREESDPAFVRSLAQDRYGAIWVGTREGLFRINHGRINSFSAEDGLPDNFVMALAGDDDGSLWVGTASGISHYKDGRFTDFDPTQESSKHPAQTIIRDRTGLVWIGLDGGGLVRVRDDKASIFAIEDGLSHNRVLSLFEDKEGSIWIGTEGGGLNRLRKGKFTTYSEQEGLSLDMTLAVYSDSQGDLWVGTEGGGLNRLRDGKTRVFTLADGLSSNIITSIYGGDEGELWVGTFRSGLNLLYDGRFQTFTTRDGLPGNGISALYRGPTGILWVATDAGLASYDGSTFTSYTSDDGLSSDIVMSVMESSTGDVWIGTYDSGLSIMSGGTIREITDVDGLGSNTVLTLHEDVGGVMWIGTYGGGLTRIKDGVVQTVTTEHGLFNDNVYQILEDDNGNLWMSCNKGIFYVDKDDLNAFFAGARVAVHSTSFDRSDGLKSYELNGGFQPAGWKAANGHLWFPSVRGVVSIDPSSLQSYETAASIVVEQVRIDGDAVAAAGPISVGPGRHKVEFDYVGLSFIKTDNLQYRYRLDGYETVWNEVQGRRTATYTNLDPGKYTFRVMVADESGEWTANEASVVVSLLPAFYQMTWFWLVCVSGLVFLAVSLYMLRIRSLKRRQRELEEEVSRRTRDLKSANDKLEEQTAALSELYVFKAQFFNNISHELRTPLTLLLGPLENALTGAYGRMNGLLRSQLEIMLRNGRRLLRLINQLLDLAKIESQKMDLRARAGDLAPFVEGIVLSFTAFALERKIELGFSSDDDIEPVYFDPEKLEKVLFNLLSNAVKFTPEAGRIDVAVRLSSTKERQVEISVGDTGPGIPADRIERIFDRYHQVDGTVSSVQEGTGIGLSLAKELVELHHGTISVQSIVGSGSTFTVFLPIGSEHLSPDELWTTAQDSEEAYEVSSTMSEMVVAASDDGQVRVDADRALTVDEDAARILVVDDNRDIREYIVGCLHPQYLVIEARSGDEALERVSEELPDLILSDVMMPGMNGHELLKQLRGNDAWRQIPFVMLTAKASETSKIEGLEMGADDYISKPFNARELKARINNLLRIHEQENQLRSLNEDLERRVREHVSRILGERRRYEQELVAARDKAEASARMKATILDNISHELRTPLSTILGYAQILSNELQEQKKDFAELIVHGGRRLLGTLGAIIDLSQLESGSVTLNPSEFPIRTLVDEIVQDHRGEAERKGLELDVVHPENHPTVHLDRDKVRRVIDNVVNNAVKFTDEGRITIELLERNSNFSVTVRDTGVGIGRRYLPQLFSPFTQESTGTVRSYEGSGLGLAVAKGLAELMFGRIDVSSEEGNGSVFVITFPSRLPARKPKAPDRKPVASDQATRAESADAQKEAAESGNAEKSSE